MGIHLLSVTTSYVNKGMSGDRWIKVVMKYYLEITLFLNDDVAFFIYGPLEKAVPPCSLAPFV